MGKKTPKESGTIASVFATLSGGSLSDSLPERFGTLKKSLVTSEAHAKALHQAWNEICNSLEKETQEIIHHGADLIPVVQYPGDKANGVNSIHEWLDDKSIEAIKKRGTVIIKGVVSQEEALGYKQSVRDYVAANPQTKGTSLFPFLAFDILLSLNHLLSISLTGFPAEDPQVYELYWSKAQLAARSE